MTVSGRAGVASVIATLICRGGERLRSPRSRKGATTTPRPCDLPSPSELRQFSVEDGVDQRWSLKVAVAYRARRAWVHSPANPDESLFWSVAVSGGSHGRGTSRAKKFSTGSVARGILWPSRSATIFHRWEERAKRLLNWQDFPDDETVFLKLATLSGARGF